MKFWCAILPLLMILSGLSVSAGPPPPENELAGSFVSAVRVTVIRSTDAGPMRVSVDCDGNGGNTPNIQEVCAAIAKATGVKITCDDKLRQARYRRGELVPAGLTIHLKNRTLGDLCLTIASDNKMRIELLGKTGFHFTK